MKIKNIAFVGIPVTDVKQAREFYEGVLGLKLTEEMGKGHWIEYAIGAQTLALANFPDQWKPAEEGTSVALEMENFDEAIQHLRPEMPDRFALLAMTDMHEGNLYPRARSRRPFSLLQSRFFSVSRLSCSFLPFATASNSLARPRSLK